MDIYKNDLIYKWRFKDYPFVQITEEKRIFNIKTGREKKIVCNCRSFGVWVDSKKFIPLSKINFSIEVIPVELKIDVFDYV